MEDKLKEVKKKIVSIFNEENLTIAEIESIVASIDIAIQENLKWQQIDYMKNNHIEIKVD